MMPVQTTYGVQVTTVETLALNIPAASATDKTVTQNGFNSTKTLNAASTPPATECVYTQKGLSSGAGTIDLTSLLGTNNRAVDLTGLKVQVFKATNPATNANPITVTFGASNPYLLAGTGFKVILSPGQEITFYGNDATPDVDSTHKNIDLAGTGTQALNIAIIAG